MRANTSCRCASSWCDLDLTFDLAVMTLTCKILSGLYLRNYQLILGRLRLGGVGVQHHVTLI